MSLPLLLGLICAALCAFFTNLGFLCRHRGCNAAAPVTLRHPLRSAVDLWKQRWFAIGMCVAAVGFIFHVLALVWAPLSLVQAIIAGGLVWLAVLAERCFGLGLGWKQWVGVGCTGLGLAMLALTIPGHSGEVSYSDSAALLFQGALVTVGVLMVLCGRHQRWSHHGGILMGACAGTMFGVSDIAIKALSLEGGLTQVLTSHWLAVAIVAGVFGFYAAARSLQTGEAVPVITITSLAANLSGIMGGFVVFGDPLPTQTLHIVLHFSAFALVLVAAWLVPAPRMADQPA